MGSEDCVEAHEKILRLPLRGEQEREVIRVLLHCMLAEKIFNPYYALLAVKLAKTAKGHRTTLQFALWDYFKAIQGDDDGDEEVEEEEEGKKKNPKIKKGEEEDGKKLSAIQIASLARFTALLVARYALPLSMLKAAKLSPADIEVASSRHLFFFRLFFRHLFSSCKDVGAVKDVFERLAAQRRQIAETVVSIQGFLKSSVGPWLANMDQVEGGKLKQKMDVDELLRRCRMAEKTLAASKSARTAF